MGVLPPANLVMSFEALYDAYVDEVWRAIRRLGVPASGVEDVVQETFVTAWQSLSRFEGRSELKTWIIGIAFNRARHAIRSHVRHGNAVELDEQLPSQSQRPDERVERRKQSELLLEMLAALPEEQREVFVMMDLEGLSAPAVADLVHAPLNTVYSRLRLARASINDAVAQLERRSA